MIKTLIVLGGPTASGKTSTGIELAKHFNTEIISADSRQIYKETRIGTAVPSYEELAVLPHHFIRFVSLRDYYNASIYENQVLDKLSNLFQEHDVVVMAGGSGLYINAVCFGIDDLPTISEEIRNDLARELQENGLEHMQEKLRSLDPNSYRNIDLKNHFRVLKALEVSVQTGKPYSSFLLNKRKSRDFRIIRVALDMDRDELYRKINLRAEHMIESGLLEEVRMLTPYRHLNAMKTVGYREIFRHLDGEISLDEAVDLIKRNTRKYARKQLTWFRKDNLYQWFHPENPKEIIGYISEKLI